MELNEIVWWCYEYLYRRTGWTRQTGTDPH